MAGFIDRRERVRERLRPRSTSSSRSFSIKARVDSLPRSGQQLVEIAKALMGEPEVLILDEPTTSLTEQETELLFSPDRRD